MGDDLIKGEVRFDFSGCVSLVTGGVRGIGRVIVDRLAESGATPIVLDLDEPDSDFPHSFRQADVGDSGSVRAAVGWIRQQHDRIDHLINNAGITRDRTIWKMTDEEWDEVLRVNLSGAFRMTRAVAPFMREQGFGRIVNIGSMSGVRGRFGQANYSAAKAGLIGLSKTVARELGSRSVTVNTVAPGIIHTPLTEALSPEVKKKTLDDTVLGRLGSSDDVAGITLFLLTDAAKHLTGQVFHVDGGHRL